MMAALGRSAAAVTRMRRPFSTKPMPMPMPMYQAMLEKLQEIKPACAPLQDVSKSVQELEANLKEYRLIWKFNQRKLLHEDREDTFCRRNYRFVVIATSVAMFIATKAAKVFA